METALSAGTLGVKVPSKVQFSDDSNASTNQKGAIMTWTNNKREYTEKHAPYRICWGCNFDSATILQSEEGTPLICECKQCGRYWDLVCPGCGWTVYGAEQHGPHLRGVCRNCGKTRPDWNVKRKKRNNAVVWYAKQKLARVCAGCGQEVAEGEYEMDHRVALCNGGRDIVDNMQVLCIKCHDDKTFADCGWRR